MYMQKF